MCYLVHRSTHKATIKESPSTTSLQNLSSLATVIACKQALTSAVVASATKLFERQYPPSLQDTLKNMAHRLIHYTTERTTIHHQQILQL
ncbi:hypothetical protein V6Z12_A07G177300 [Gossypium hirsutum]